MPCVDTSVLVHGFDDSDPAKRHRAQLVMRRLWETRTGRISHQVLHEFYVTVTRKLHPSLPRPLARSEVEDLLDWSPVRPSAALLQKAWRIEDRYGLSWWDSLIVAAALFSGCTTLLSEDLQHGPIVENLRVTNPFHPGFDIDELTGNSGKPQLARSRRAPGRAHPDPRGKRPPPFHTSRPSGQSSERVPPPPEFSANLPEKRRVSC